LKITQQDTKPLVSIIIPVFNGKKYLGEAIESALTQTYPNLEILVINDGSTDAGATRRIALAYREKIQYFEKPNGGVASALNYGLKVMSGLYFSWLSHDDIYYQEKIARQVQFLKEKDPNGICYCDYDIIDENSSPVSVMRLKEIKPQDFRCFITETSDVHGCSLLIPRRHLLNLGGFGIGKRTTQDYDLWFRLAERFTFYHLKEVLMACRRHAEQDTVALGRIAREEGDALYTHFVNSLSDREVQNYCGVSAAFFFTELAEILYKRGFFSAYDAARQRGKIFLRRHSMLDYFRIKSLIIYQLFVSLPLFSIKCRLKAFIYNLRLLKSN